MMLTRTEKQNLSDPVMVQYSNLETILMQNIIRHLRGYSELIDSDVWLLQKLAEIGRLDAENMRIIAEAAGLSRTSVERMLNDTVDLVMERVEPGLNALERQGIIDGAVPARESENVRNAVKALQTQAFDSLNVCNTVMLYKARDAYKHLVQETVQQAQEISNKQEFLDTLEKHVTAEITGVESRQQAIRNTIKEFNKKGIPAFVDKAGREWTPEAYISMTMRTTAGNTATEAMMARMNDHGLSLIQMSSHAGARPKCAKDQGKIFDRNNSRGTTTDLHGKEVPYYPLRESSYGEPDGILGINCGHHGTPFIPGISTQRYFPTKDLKDNDKLYKKMQMQRGLEREIRKQKRLCMLYDEAGDQEAFEESAVKLKQKEAQLKSYVNSNEQLHRRKDREQVVGFDKHVSSRAVAGKKRVVNKANASYNEGSTEANIKVYYKDERLRKQIKSDSTPKTVESGKQGKHIKGHNNYTEGRSYLTLSEKEAQDLINKYAGTGEMRRDKQGNWTNKEFVRADKKIGFAVDPITGEEFETSRFSIHYSKKGVHIVPRKEE